MKKHSLAEFFKSKSFYALLCVGALAIIAITMVGLNQSSDKSGNENLVDLNEPNTSEVADGDIIDDDVPDMNNQPLVDTANNNSGSQSNEVAQNDLDNINGPVSDGSLLEFDIYDDNVTVSDNDAVDTPVADDAQDVSTTTETANETQTNEEVASEEVMSLETLHFDAEKGLLWPITGNVLLNYSVDRVIYHPTLEQFRVNPAVIIDANVGDNVLSAAQGIVTSISNEDETGLTVTVAIGNGYSLVYGQLQDITVAEGDSVLEGDIIGTVATPTKYYSVEGGNLYFKVLKDDETVNPMLLLR